jgi:hypothetical protein
MGGCFQSVQGRITSRTEGGVARLATKRLDQLSLAVLAIANQRVKVSIGVAEVRALSVRTGETLGIDAFGGTSPAFDLAPGSHRRRRWSFN